MIRRVRGANDNHPIARSTRSRLKPTPTTLQRAIFPLSASWQRCRRLPLPPSPSFIAKRTMSTPTPSTTRVTSQSTRLSKISRSERMDIHGKDKTTRDIRGHEKRNSQKWQSGNRDNVSSYRGTREDCRRARYPQSKLDVKQGESAKCLVKYAEHIILIPRREYIVTGNQLDQLLKDIKRGKVECDGFKNPATLDFDNAENERITEITE